MISHIAVILPANDEQEHIDACLTAIQCARDRLHQESSWPVTSSVILVLDDCHDNTAALARRHRVRAVTCAAKRVGAARRVGAEHALAASVAAPQHLWLANTDADSLVPPDWLTRMVGFANAGSEVVLGTVIPGPGLATRVLATWHAQHLADDGHPHVHGANLGILGATYLALGGWARVSTGEDVDLAARAVRAGYDVHRTASIPVITSSRTLARAPHGFSGYLRNLAGGVNPGLATPSSPEQLRRRRRSTQAAACPASKSRSLP